MAITTATFGDVKSATFQKLLAAICTSMKLNSGSVPANFTDRNGATIAQTGTPGNDCSEYEIVIRLNPGGISAVAEVPQGNQCRRNRPDWYY